MRSGTKLAVIGAGASGLTTIKALADAGIAFDCFEKGKRVGGNWVFRNENGLSSAYRSLCINTSRERMQFRDLPMPAEYPDYPGHELVAAYFEQYAAHFDLHRRIRFECTVTRAMPADRGAWRVELDDGTSAEYSGLVVANGHHSQPRWPDPPLPGQFAGDLLHSHDYLDPDEPKALRGKRVVVVGMGNSAMDIACELAAPGVAERVILSARRGAWVLPKYAFGKPIDQTRLLPRFLPVSLRQTLGAIWYRLYVGRPEDYGLPRPDHRIGSAHPTLSSEIFERLRSGRITVRPAPSELAGNRVRFSDGSEEPADAIVFCTGYKLSFPFFDPALLSAPDNDLPLFLRLFDLERPNLWFVGLCQPLGAIMPIAELQAKLLAEYLRGSYALPPLERMRERTQHERARMFARYVPSPRHTMQVDFDDFMAELRAELAAGRRRARRTERASA